jgi:hypothetical protein
MSAIASVYAGPIHTCTAIVQPCIVLLGWLIAVCIDIVSTVTSIIPYLAT